MAKEIKPWDRQPNETQKAYEAFCVYRDLKDAADPAYKRSIARTGEKLGKSESLLERWSGRYDWVRRAEKWDVDQEQKLRAEAERKRLADIRSMRRRHADLAAAILEKAANALQHLPEEAIRPRDISQMVDVASKSSSICRITTGKTPAMPVWQEKRKKTDNPRRRGGNPPGR